MANPEGVAPCAASETAVPWLSGCGFVAPVVASASGDSVASGVSFASGVSVASGERAPAVASGPSARTGTVFPEAATARVRP